MLYVRAVRGEVLHRDASRRYLENCTYIYVLVSNQHGRKINGMASLFNVK